MNGLAKRNRKIKQVRADPQTTMSWLCSTDSYETLCCSGYTKLSDNPEIMSAVNKICDLISSMTIHQMENTENGDIRIKDGLSRMMDIEPNARMTRKTFISAIVRNMLLKGDGNSIVLPETKDGYLNNMRPIPPGQVTFVQYSAYDYKVSINGTIYSPDDVLHFVINPDEDYPWKGTGYRTTLKEVAGNLKQAAATKKGFMESKWKPSVIVKVDGLTEEFASPEGREKLLESYIETGRVGDPWLIPAEQFDIKEIKPLSLQDLAISDAVTIDKKTIAAILDVPPFIVGAGEYKEAEWNNFINTRIRPLCNVLELEFTKKLLISPNRYFRFNVRSLYNYDIKTLSEVGANMYTRGIMEGNEVRDWIGMSPKDGLDKLVILENYIPAGMIGDQKKLNQGGGDNG